MRDGMRHLPFVLVIFILAVLAMTNQAVGADYKVFVTLLAPTLWLGLYFLFGSDRAARKQ
jgi:hypothetical protein